MEKFYGMKKWSWRKMTEGEWIKFKYKNCEKSGKIIKISKGGLFSYNEDIFVVILLDDENHLFEKNTLRIKQQDLEIIN